VHHEFVDEHAERRARPGDEALARQKAAATLLLLESLSVVQ
jgi:hypothetical protein